MDRTATYLEYRRTVLRGIYLLLDVYIYMCTYKPKGAPGGPVYRMAETVDMQSNIVVCCFIVFPGIFIRSQGSSVIRNGISFSVCLHACKDAHRSQFWKSHVMSLIHLTGSKQTMYVISVSL